MSKLGHWFTSDWLRLSATTRPTSAARDDCPTASNASTDLSLPASNIQLYLHDSTYASYPRRTSSCEHLQLDHTSWWHHPSSWRPHTTAADIYIHVCNSSNKIVTFVVSVILPFCLPSLSLADTTLARIKPLNYLRSQCTYTAPQQLHLKNEYVSAVVFKNSSKYNTHRSILHSFIGVI